MSKLTVSGADSENESHSKLIRDAEVFVKYVKGIHSASVIFVGGRNVRIVFVQRDVPMDDDLSDCAAEWEVNLACCPKYADLNVDVLVIPRVSDETRDDFERMTRGQ